MEQTVHFVNASDFFDAIELGDAESGEFLEQFTFGDALTDITLVAKTTFLQRLTKFIDMPFPEIRNRSKLPFRSGFKGR